MMGPHAMRGLSRRAVLRLLGAGAGLTLAAACVPSAPRGAVSTPASSGNVSGASATNTPARGGTLRVGISGDFARLDGHLIAGSLPTALWTVFDRLTSYDDQLNPQPLLAESWESSNDGRQIKLNLRKGVEFHTGREITAEDVKWNFERVKDPKVGTLAARAQVISGYDLPDRHTVVLKADRPWREAFDLLEYTNMLDPVTMQGPEALAKPVGTGPFRFGEYMQGDHLRVVRNEHYWRSDLPYLDEIWFSIFNDPQAMVSQFEARVLHVASGLPVPDTVRLRNTPDYQVAVNARTGAFICVCPNATRPPTNNKYVRQALNYALDRKRMADSVLLGLTDPKDLPWAPSSPAFDAARNGAYAFNLDRARNLLQQAGVTQAAFDISWSTASSPFATIAQIYQADLARIGITTSLRPLEPAAYQTQVEQQSYTGVVIAGGLNGHLQPATMIQGPYYGPQYNYSGFADEAYSQLANDALVEGDQSRQRDLYSKLNDVYLDESWVMPLMQNVGRAAAQSNVRGLRYNMHEALAIPEVWLAA